MILSEQTQITHEENTNVIKVIVLIGNFPNASLMPDEKQYQGLYYDIWKNIKSELHDYVIEETFLDIDHHTYTKLIHLIHNNQYDILIGSIIMEKTRNKLVNYTIPITIDHNSLIYYPKLNIFKTIYNITTKILLKPILYVSIIGVIIGSILYFIAPPRKNNIIGKKYSIINSISSLLRIPGFIKKHSHLNIVSTILIIILSILAFLFVVIIQSYITNNILTSYSNIDLVYNAKSIKNKSIICPKNQSSCNYLSTYNVNITLEGNTIDESIRYYIKNKDKYIGVGIRYYDALYYQKKYPFLVAGRSNLGYLPYYWIVSKNRKVLLDKINRLLFEMKNNLQIEKICKYYMSSSDVNLCNIT